MRILFLALVALVVAHGVFAEYGLSEGYVRVLKCSVNGHRIWSRTCYDKFCSDRNEQECKAEGGSYSCLSIFQNTKGTDTR